MDGNLKVNQSKIKKLTKKLRELFDIACFTIFIVIFMLIVTELILAPIVKSKAWLNRPLTSLDMMDEHYPAPPSYANAIWFEAYRREFNASVTFDWQPYLYWKTKPFSGKYINVDEDRTRKTWLYEIKTGSSQSKNKKRIFIFGGSTVWGWGARDDYTIPSLVNKYLFEKYGINIEIINFGEIAFVSTQEILRLMFELQKGNIPDIVVFYDGLNDIYSALRPGQTGVIGVACDEFQRKNLFESKYPILRWIYENYIVQSGMFKIATRLLNKDKAIPITLDSKQVEIISENIIQLYQRNLDIIEALSKKYNFDILCYWQPTIFSKRDHSDFEKELEKAAQTALFSEAVFKQVNEKARKIQRSTFHNISDILETKTTYYIDFSHIDEKGNDIIAARIARDLVNKILNPTHEAFP